MYQCGHSYWVIPFLLVLHLRFCMSINRHKVKLFSEKKIKLEIFCRVLQVSNLVTATICKNIRYKPTHN